MNKEAVEKKGLLSMQFVIITGNILLGDFKYHE